MGVTVKKYFIQILGTTKDAQGKTHKSSIFCATRHASSVAVKIIICLQLPKFCSIQFT